MRDRSKQLLVINTGKKESEQTRLPAQSGTTHIIGGGGLSVNMSDYLLKSIWDKVFEIRTDGQGKEYIFGKLPMVTQYGITMYSGDGVDIPSLASGLPFDGRTIWYNPDTQQIEVIGGTGGGSGEGVSNFWDLSGIPSWITNSKPKYSYSEIEGTPDLSVYAQVDTLKAYVTLAGAQTLTGEKNFTGGLKVNGSPIIYDSVNKCWKLQGNLVLTGGITMYADDGTLNLPSIYDGLPIDGTTIYWDTDAAGNRVLKAVGGGGTADSVAWNNITGKPSWIGSSKPTYSYSEIQGTPDLSVYALKTQIPSLSGYATESWVTKQNYATKATTLSGYGITDAYTKTNVDDLLKSYVTLGGTQTITGEKNFTGGLKVNGSPIYYDTEKKYWKLEGDLLVTGGVTMYGSDSSFAPSTIMDAIAVDGTTISKDGGVLKVIGGTGGGVADSVAWANITGKPTWIGSSKPTYSYSEITGAISTTELQNYLTQNSYLNVTGGDNRYLKLSGGTLTNTLTIDNSNVGLILHRSGQSTPYIRFGQDTNNEWGELGVYHDGRLVFWPLVSSQGGYNQWNTVWHEGNFKPSNYLPLSGGTINGDFGVLKIKRRNQNASAIGFSNINGSLGYIGYNDDGSACIWGADMLGRKVIIHSLGGTIDSSFGAFSIKRNEPLASTIKFENTRGILGYLGFNDDYTIKIWDKNKSNPNTIWHEGNDGIDSGLDADLLDGVQSSGYGQYVDNLSINLNDARNGLRGGKLYNATNAYDSIDASYRGFLEYGSSGYRAQFNSSSSNDLYYRWCEANTWKPWRKVAFEDSNVASATKLQTSRTIWGQSFDGTGNVSGVISNTSTIEFDTSSGAPVIGYLWTNTRGMHMDMSGLGTEQQGTNLTLTRYGNVGIGTPNPSQKLHVKNGNITCDGGFVQSYRTNNPNSSGAYMRLTSYYPEGDMTWDAIIASDYYGNHLCTTGGFTHGMYFKSGRYGYDNFIFLDSQGNPVARLSTSSGSGNHHFVGNMLVTGGITMYSDQRKKTILNHVELSLKQIAEAPLIEHYYNGDDKRTTHVGSIAQYWASMNDWFCKLDSEGYYTMEIQNAALASAISVARELVKFENETDKRIRLLEEENKELRNEVERLKCA